MTVHQLQSQLELFRKQLHNLLLGLQLLFEGLQLGLQLTGGLHLVHRHGLPLGELVRHGWVLHWEEGGEEEEAQDREADNFHPTSQGQHASGQIRPGGWPLGETPS